MDGRLMPMVANARQLHRPHFSPYAGSPLDLSIISVLAMLSCGVLEGISNVREQMKMVKEEGRSHDVS